MLGFDTDKYLKTQEKAIRKRISKFEGKIYIEFGGKFVDDNHAARVLKGYRPNTKIELLKRLEKDLDFTFCISARHIKNNKQRTDFGIGYDEETLRVINRARELGVDINKVVITLIDDSNEGLTENLVNRLEKNEIKVWKHRAIEGYPDVMVEDLIKNPYIKTNKKVMIVTGAGPGSGKFGVCITQLAHDFQKGLDSGYAKFETFPIWNLPLEHPVNKAYESATADLGDRVIPDRYHLKAYGVRAVNYNRDIENFEMMKRLLNRITREGNFVKTYQSPTDMGFNTAKTGIINDEVVRKCAVEECKRRVKRYKGEFEQGLTSKQTVERARKILDGVLNK